MRRDGNVGSRTKTELVCSEPENLSLLVLGQEGRASVLGVSLPIGICEGGWYIRQDDVHCHTFNRINASLWMEFQELIAHILLVRLLKSNIIICYLQLLIIDIILEILFFGHTIYAIDIIFIFYTYFHILISIWLDRPKVE